jgi:hypothetical protein
MHHVTAKLLLASTAVSNAVMLRKARRIVAAVIRIAVSPRTVGHKGLTLRELIHRDMARGKVLKRTWEGK